MIEGTGSGPLGKYANHFTVGSNALEIVLDFGQWYEGDDVQLHTRIVTTPRYALTLMQLLAETLGQYQARYGALGPES